MRVGVVFDEFPPEAGGGHTFQLELLNRIEKHVDARHELLPILPNGAWSGGGSARIRYSPAGRVRRTLERLAPADSFGRMAGESRFDTICRRHRLDLLWFTFPILREPPPDSPFIATVLDLQHRRSPWFPEVSAHGEWARRERLIGRTVRRAAFILASGEAGRQELHEFYQVPAERILGLPHPTPDWAMQSSFENASVTLEKFDLPQGFLLYPAQFWAHKNHANLLIALHELKTRHGIEVPIVLTGDDRGNRTHVERLADTLGLSDQLHILGFVDRNDLGCLYRSALALTYVTLFGPENLPPLEAMALGCPVIASNIAGASDQLGDAAVLVNPLEPSEIARAVRQLVLEQETRQTLIERGRERAARWTVGDFLGEVDTLFDRFEPVRRTWS
jgi:glycosyltransferase involved in cell wall biosynthesis